MLTLGSDPEFSLWKKDTTGKLIRVDACNVLEGDTNAPVGTDGNNRTGEMRPKYGKTVQEHYNNIWKLMRRLNKEIKEKQKEHEEIYTIRAGSGEQEPLGGHIHFGTKAEPKLVKQLDVMSLFMLFLEQKRFNIERRCRSNYGQLGNVRDQPHGFEYRTPASWLVSPLIARGTLSLFYAVTADYKAGIQNKFLNKVSHWINHYDIDQYFKEANTDVFRYKLKTIERGIQSLTRYRKNTENTADYINSMLSLIKQGRDWKETRDVLTTWKLRDITKEKVVMETKPLFVYNLKDEFLQEMMGFVPNKEISKKKNNILVFGLKKTRKFDVSTNNYKIHMLVCQFMASKGKQLSVDIANIYKHQFELGLSHAIRADKELCSGLLTYIMNNQHRI